VLTRWLGSLSAPSSGATATRVNYQLPITTHMHLCTIRIKMEGYYLAMIALESKAYGHIFVPFPSNAADSDDAGTGHHLPTLSNGIVDADTLANLLKVLSCPAAMCSTVPFLLLLLLSHV
jgi:hypothetical protein